MSTDPVKISRWALVVAILALGVSLIGPLFGADLVSRVQPWFARRAAHEQQVFQYLRQAAVFLDGLPLYITETWAWGPPGVPNYSPPTFPDPHAAIADEMPSVRDAVVAALQLHELHTQKMGVPYYAKEEALWRLSELRRRFWHATEEVAKAEWPWQWRSKLEELRRAKIPDTERERLQNLKRTRQ
jgi:hypothetical protein